MTPTPEEHLAEIANWMLGTPMFIGLFSGDYIPDGTETGSTIAALATEFVGYEETSRRPSNLYYLEGGVITNDGNEASFTLTQDVRIYGHFVITNQTKGGTSGTVRQVKRWDQYRDFKAGDVVRVLAGRILTPTNI